MFFFFFFFFFQRKKKAMLVLVCIPRQSPSVSWMDWTMTCTTKREGSSLQNMRTSILLPLVSEVSNILLLFKENFGNFHFNS